MLVSASPYYPAQARTIMRQYADNVSKAQQKFMRARLAGGEAQIQALLASTRAFADSYDDMNFTLPYLSTI